MVEGRNGIRVGLGKPPGRCIFPKPDRLPEAFPNEQTLPAEPSLILIIWGLSGFFLYPCEDRHI